MAAKIYDIIIVGGGTAAGLESHPSIEQPLGYRPGTGIEYPYQSQPQKYVGGKVLNTTVGKVLGGSSAVNYQTWVRGPSVDYDQWAAHVRDDRWSWKGLLPCFKRSETWFPPGDDGDVDWNLHGRDGPIKLSHPSTRNMSRKFPLRNTIEEAFQEFGIKKNADINDGKLLGYSENCTSTYQGRRQWAADGYKPGANVDVLVETQAEQILVAGGRVTGVKVSMSDGKPRSFTARLEVILSAGAYGSPKLLLLSGIGPTEELKRHGITQVVDSPVGENLFDHAVIQSLWKLRDRNVSFGDVEMKTADCDWLAGTPIDWMAFFHNEDQVLEVARRELDAANAERYQAPNKVHTSTFSMYGPFDGTGLNFELPKESSILSNYNILLSPTSRGTVKLASPRAADPPIIDSNLFSTELDRMAMRARLVKYDDFVEKFLGPKLGLEEIAVPDEFRGRNTSDDDVFDWRLKTHLFSMHHQGGTCAMGHVVNSDCEVVGVKGLRVVDASIFPFPMACYSQAPVYAVAEQAADIIAASIREKMED